MTATEIASSRLETLCMSLFNGCELSAFFGIPRKGLPKSSIQKGNIELDVLDTKEGVRQFLVSEDGRVPFILATELPYSDNSILAILSHASVSDGNNPHCKKCSTSRNSNGCFGRRVLELRSGL